MSHSNKIFIDANEIAAFATPVKRESWQAHDRHFVYITLKGVSNSFEIVFMDSKIVNKLVNVLLSNRLNRNFFIIYDKKEFKYDLFYYESS